MHRLFRSQVLLNAVLIMVVGVHALASCGALSALMSAHPAHCPSHEAPAMPTESMRCCSVIDADLRISTQRTGIETEQAPAVVVSWAPPPTMDEHHRHLADPAATRGHSPPVRTALLI